MKTLKKKINAHERNVMKRDNISVKQDIFDLVSRASSFFFVLRDNVENGNEKKISQYQKSKNVLGVRLENLKKNINITF